MAGESVVIRTIDTHLPIYYGSNEESHSIESGFLYIE